MPTPAHLSYGTVAASTSWASMAVGASNAEANADAIPTNCRLDKLRLAFDTVAGGATGFYWYLSEDSDGKWPLTAVSAIVNPTAGKPGSTFWQHAVDLADHHYAKSANHGADGVLYLHLKLDAGTANATSYLSWTLP